MIKGSVEILAFRTEDRTYCQIAGQEITAQTCRSSQGQAGCFGCASPYRRCEPCDHHLVAVPAVGMCSLCLRQALSEEEKRGKPTFASDMRVSCQLLGREIKVPICEATQGQEGCHNCPVPSRLCEKCKERLVRFPRYGLCLRCSVEEFGEGWQPTQTDGDEETIPRVSRDLSMIQESGGVFMGQGNSTEEPSRERQLAALTARARQLLLKSDRKDVPAYLLQQKLRMGYDTAQQVLNRLEKDGVVGPRKAYRPREILRGEKKISPMKKGRRVPKAKQLLPVAKRTILKYGEATTTFLEDHLHVSWKTAGEIIRLLEQEGFVGPPRGRAGREILVTANPAKQETLSQPSLTLPGVKRVEALIKSLGEKSEFGGILRSLIADALALKRLKTELRDLVKKN